MYKDERDIFHYDAVSHAWHKKYKGLPPCSHFDMAKALSEIFKLGRAEAVKPRNKQSVYITELDLYSDRCEMLVGFSDPNAADPTFNDRPAKKRRVVPKVGNEGLEHSAHIFWHYDNAANAAPCNFYLEGAVGLSSAAIVTFINRLLREFCKIHPDHFSRPDPSGERNPDGTSKLIKLRPRLELRGHPSAEFIKDLKNGEISELELLTASKAAKTWDTHGYAVEEHRGVLLKPNSAKHVPKAKAFIDGVLNPQVKKDYEMSRVVFKTEGDIRKNVRFYSQNYHLVNDLRYVKKSRINSLGGNLPNAFESINSAIMTRIRTIATGGSKALSKKKLAP